MGFSTGVSAQLSSSWTLWPIFSCIFRVLAVLIWRASYKLSMHVSTRFCRQTSRQLARLQPRYVPFSRLQSTLSSLHSKLWRLNTNFAFRLSKTPGKTYTVALCHILQMNSLIFGRIALIFDKILTLTLGTQCSLVFVAYRCCICVSIDKVLLLVK